MNLGLLDKRDLGFWVYWLFVIGRSPSLVSFARFAGYGVFLRDLQVWVANSPEMLELVECRGGSAAASEPK